MKCKQCVVNIKNSDNYSILYSLAAAFKKIIPKINKSRKSHYGIANIKYKSVRFPTPIIDIEKLEIQNSIKINVYGYDSDCDEIKLVYKSEEKRLFRKLVDLLVLNRNTTPHYVYISNLKNLIKMSSSVSWLCKSCLNVFEIKKDYESHLIECRDDEIEIPVTLRSKRGLFMLDCKENTLQWSITAALHPTYTKSGRRCRDTSSYEKWYHLIGFPDITYLKIQEAVLIISKKCSLNINIFIYEKGEIFPFIISNSKHEQFVDLMMLSKGNNQIFFIIKDLTSIYSNRLKVRRKHFVCRRCLEIFLSSSKLAEHDELCRNFQIQKTCMSEEKELKFTNYRKQFEIPFVVYADFEVILKPIDTSVNESHEHIPIAVAYKLYSYIKGETKKTVVYTGIDCVREFINDLIEIYKSVEHYFRLNKSLKMTKQDVIKFKNSSSCHICGKLFEGSTIKVRDHDHYTGM